jgi:hypothetical protein
MKMRYAKHKTTGKVIATMSGGDESNASDLQSFIDSGLGYDESDLNIGYASKEQIATWTEATVTEAEKVIANRKAEYPSLEDCIHAILDDDLENLQAKRQAVKEKYPK